MVTRTFCNKCGMEIDPNQSGSVTAKGLYYVAKAKGSSIPMPKVKKITQRYALCPAHWDEFRTFMETPAIPREPTTGAKDKNKTFLVG